MIALPFRKLGSRREQLIRSIALMSLVGCTSEQPQTLPKPVGNASAERVYSKHFGVVPFNQTMQHDFYVKNKMPFSVSIANIDSSCACTVAKPEFEAIEAGGSGRIRVVYKSPRETTNDRKLVRIRFKESEAPGVVLEILALARDPINVHPKLLDLGQVGVDGHRSASLEVQNYRPGRVDRIRAEARAEWLKISTPKSITVGGEMSPTQAWSIGIKAEVKGLKPGLHRGTIKLILDKEEAEATVTCLVTTPITPIPPQLFFGRVEPDKAYEQRIILRFAPNMMTPEPESVAFSHSLNNKLTLKCAKDFNNYLIINAKLSDLQNSLHNEKLIIRFNGTNYDPIEIPISALSSRPGGG